MPDSTSIRKMFSGISPRYDLLNHLLSLGIDRGWRRRAVQSLRSAASNPGSGLPGDRGVQNPPIGATPPGSRSAPGRALDLCCGTGDLTLELARGGFETTGVDFCHEMLVRGMEKGSGNGSGRLRLAEGDALNLPFQDGSFEAATVAFGIRNLQSLERGLAEIARILSPGGRVAILEFGHPKGLLLSALYKFYLHGYVPVVGRLFSGDSEAYAYLASSIQAFPDKSIVSGHLVAAGFVDVAAEDQTGGIATLYTGSKPLP
jgi:demethylmenaquinone methyltransferase/2-methoxy-6-polyprenyl-1,4-benzoquinol methylase